MATLKLSSVTHPGDAPTVLASAVAILMIRIMPGPWKHIKHTKPDNLGFAGTFYFHYYDFQYCSHSDSKGDVGDWFINFKTYLDATRFVKASTFLIRRQRFFEKGDQQYSSHSRAADTLNAAVTS